MDAPPDAVVTLPLPPSANRIWRLSEGGGIHRAKAYRAWLNTVGWECLVAKATGRVPGRFTLRLSVPETLRDPDNSIKPTLDGIQKAGVIANDKHLRALLLRVDPARNAAATMLVEVWRAEAA